MVSKKSFDHVEKWAKEVLYHEPKAMLVLVGTHVDARLASSITEQDAESKANKIGAYKYVECSAKNGHNVELAFETAVQAHWNRNSVGLHQQQQGTCLVM